MNDSWLGFIRLLGISIIGAIVCLLTSCSSTAVDGARTYGQGAHHLSTTEVREAVAAERFRRSDRVVEINVVSPNEVHFYFDRRTSTRRNYDVVKRIEGKWRFDSTYLAEEQTWMHPTEIPDHSLIEPVAQALNGLNCLLH